MLLRPALGGSAKTAIIGTISPATSALFETKSTLHYMCMAKQIKNRPKVNQSLTQKTLVADLEREQDRLRAQLAAQRAKAGVYIPTEQYEEECAQRKELEAKIAGFNEVLKKKDDQIENGLADMRKLTKQLDAMRATCEAQQVTIVRTKTELDKTKTRLTSETRRACENGSLKTAHYAYGLNMRDVARGERDEVVRMSDVAARQLAKRHRLEATLDNHESSALDLDKDASEWCERAKVSASSHLEKMNEFAESVMKTGGTLQTVLEKDVSALSALVNDGEQSVRCTLDEAQTTLRDTMKKVTFNADKQMEQATLACKHVHETGESLQRTARSFLDSLNKDERLLPMLRVLVDEWKSSSKSRARSYEDAAKENADALKNLLETSSRSSDAFSTKLKSALDLLRENSTKRWTDATDELESARTLRCQRTKSAFDSLSAETSKHTESMSTSATENLKSTTSSIEAMRGHRDAELNALDELRITQLESTLALMKDEIERNECRVRVWVDSETKEYKASEEFVRSTADAALTLAKGTREALTKTVNMFVDSQAKLIDDARSGNETRWNRAEETEKDFVLASQKTRGQFLQDTKTTTATHAASLNETDAKHAEKETISLGTFTHSNDVDGKKINEHLSYAVDQSRSFIDSFASAADETSNRERDSTKKSLQDRLESVKRENQTLREQLRAFSDRARKDRERLRNDMVALLDATLESQAKAHEEDMNALLSSIEANDESADTFVNEATARVVSVSSKASDARRKFVDEYTTKRSEWNQKTHELVSERTAKARRAVDTISKEIDEHRATRCNMRMSHADETIEMIVKFDESRKNSEERRLNEHGDATRLAIANSETEYKSLCSGVAAFKESTVVHTKEAETTTSNWYNQTISSAETRCQKATDACVERKRAAATESESFRRALDEHKTKILAAMRTLVANSRSANKLDASTLVQSAIASTNARQEMLDQLNKCVETMTFEAYKQAETDESEAKTAADRRATDSVAELTSSLVAAVNAVKSNEERTSDDLTKCSAMCDAHRDSHARRAQRDQDDSRKLCENILNATDAISKRASDSTDEIVSLAEDAAQHGRETQKETTARMTELRSTWDHANAEFDSQKSKIVSLIGASTAQILSSLGETSSHATKVTKTITAKTKEMAEVTSTYTRENLVSSFGTLIERVGRHVTTTKQRPAVSGTTPSRKELRAHANRYELGGMPLILSPVNETRLRTLHRAGVKAATKRRIDDADDSEAKTPPASFEAVVAPPIPPPLRTLPSVGPKSTAETLPPLSNVLQPRNQPSVEHVAKKAFKPKRRRASTAGSVGGENHASRTPRSSAQKNRKSRRASVGARITTKSEWTPKKRGTTGLKQPSRRRSSLATPGRKKAK